MAFDGWNYFKSAGYNYLIRSDMDGYSSDFNIKRLKRIASII